MYRRKLSWILSAAVVALWSSSVFAGEPCCSIVSVDAQKGIVTGKEIATGRTFEFVVNDAELIKELKVGQQLAADFGAKSVIIPKHRFSITKVSEPSATAQASTASKTKQTTTVRSSAQVTAAENTTTGAIRGRPGTYKVSPPDANGLLTIKHVQSGQTTRHRADSRWQKALALVRFLKNGNVQGQTEGGAEAEHQSICDQVSQSSNGGRPCRADCTLTTTGSDPSTIDDEFSCTCICS